MKGNKIQSDNKINTKDGANKFTIQSIACDALFELKAR